MKKVLIGLLVVVAIFVVVVALRPSDVKVERSVTINAPPATVLAVIEDFHQWKAWDPWAKLDPTMVEEFSGATSGVGAKYYWKGNDKVGEGRMEILSVSPTDAKLKLEFIKPFAQLNDVDFTAVPAANGTKVTWAFVAHQKFMAKAFSLFMSLDKMVGPDFERGLSQLKSLTEPSVQKVISPIHAPAPVVAQPAAP